MLVSLHLVPDFKPLASRARDRRLYGAAAHCSSGFLSLRSLLIRVPNGLNPRVEFRVQRSRLHQAPPIRSLCNQSLRRKELPITLLQMKRFRLPATMRSEEHTSELQSL